MLDRPTAKYLHQLCHRRAADSPALSDQLWRIAENRGIGINLDRLIFQADHFNLADAIRRLDRATNGIVFAYWFQQINAIAMNYAAQQGIDPKREAEAQQDDFREIILESSGG